MPILTYIISSSGGGGHYTAAKTIFDNLPSGIAEIASSDAPIAYFQNICYVNFYRQQIPLFLSYFDVNAIQDLA